jgi:hypothetical protein
MNCKFDIHLNLEQFPTSRNSDTKIYSSVDDLAEFIKRNEVGAAVTLYPRDGYHYMEQLAQKTPDVTHYGVQVLMGVDENDATDIKALELDALDNSKVYCKGIKIASHRGWWNRDGKIDSGLDYGKESNKIHKWLKQLPDNSIVSMHMQGDPINNSASVPMTVGMYAYKYPKLKFIMNHMGDYGQGGLSNKPKSYVTQTKDGPNLFPAFRYAHSRALCKAAVEYANVQHNIILDTSVYIPNKSEMLKDCYRWAVGSDYPFCKSDNLFVNEEKKFIRDMGEDAVNKAHANAKWFFDSDYKQLIKKNITLNNFGDLNATTTKRATQKA